MRTRSCGTNLLIVVCAGAIHTVSLPADADIPPAPMDLPGEKQDILERRRKVHAEELMALEAPHMPSVSLAPRLIPRYLFWPAFGLFNVGLVTAWLLAARYCRSRSGGAILLPGLSQRRRRRRPRMPAARRVEPGAIRSLLSLLRRRKRRRQRRSEHVARADRSVQRRERHSGQHHRSHRSHHRHRAHGRTSGNASHMSSLSRIAGRAL